MEIWQHIDLTFDPIRCAIFFRYFFLIQEDVCLVKCQNNNNKSFLAVLTNSKRWMRNCLGESVFIPVPSGAVLIYLGRQPRQLLHLIVDRGLEWWFSPLFWHSISLPRNQHCYRWSSASRDESECTSCRWSSLRIKVVSPYFYINYFQLVDKQS